MSIQAKFFFSTKPFDKSSSGSKQKFKSGDFIYGRIEVGTPLEKIFKMPALSKNYPVAFLIYKVFVFRDGDQFDHHNSWVYTRVNAEDRGNTYFNFDVLPEPPKATTMICGVPEFNTGIGAGPLYQLIDRSHFPNEGKYTIKVVMSHWTFDPYNPEQISPESEWATCSGEFEFDYSMNDIALLQKNGIEANNLVKENARLKAMDARGLPEQWNWKSAPIGSGYKEKELIDMFLQKEDSSCECLKAVVYPVTGPVWNVEKNHLSDPVQKWHNQTVGFFAKNNGRYFYIVGGLRQTYEGGGVYGPTYFQWEKSDELNGKYIEEALGSGGKNKAESKSAPNKAAAKAKKK
jgi:hypothetical protein